jgi:hypothetical protein
MYSNIVLAKTKVWFCKGAGYDGFRLTIMQFVVASEVRAWQSRTIQSGLVQLAIASYLAMTNI